MVYIKDLRSQWPWNPQAAQDMSDKEIYTYMIGPADRSNRWRIPIEAPMDGFAYVGVRIIVADAPAEYPILPYVVRGYSDNHVFGIPWDNLYCLNGKWRELGFPLTNRMIAIDEEGLDLIVTHQRACYGKVEFIAQRLEDIRVEEDVTYAFLDDRKRQVAWLLTPRGHFYKPDPMDGSSWNGPVKMIPCLTRVLDSRIPEWHDTREYQDSVRLNQTLEDVAPWPLPQ